MGWMQMIVRRLMLVLGALLPLHGLLTVMLPEPVRWWKEAVLGALILILLVVYFIA